MDNKNTLDILKGPQFKKMFPTVLIHALKPNFKAVKLLSHDKNDSINWSCFPILDSLILTNYQRRDNKPVSVEEVMDLVEVINARFFLATKDTEQDAQKRSYMEDIQRKSRELARNSKTQFVFAYKKGMVPLLMRRIGRHDFITSRGIEFYSDGISICCDERAGMNTKNWQAVANKTYGRIDNRLDLNGEDTIFEYFEVATARRLAPLQQNEKHEAQE